MHVDGSKASGCCEKISDWLIDHKEGITVGVLATAVAASVAGAIWIGPNYAAQALFQPTCLLAGQGALVASGFVQGFRKDVKSTCRLVTQIVISSGSGCSIAAAPQFLRGVISAAGFILGLTLPNQKCNSSPDVNRDPLLDQPMEPLS